MIISLNWLKKFTDIAVSPDALADLIGSRLVEIESVENVGDRYRNIVVAEVKEVHEHPDADKLAVYFADDKGTIKNVERLESGLIQVISGDMDIKPGDKVAWIAPGAAVPESVENGEPFILGSREMRGKISHGMFGSGKELGLNNDSAKVLILDTKSPAGTLFADAYELNDYLLDIENKSLTHRPDCFGVVGFAREVAGIQGKRFETPEWLKVLEPVLGEIDNSVRTNDPEINIENAEFCPRYEAAIITGLDATRQSPQIIQSYLKRVGIRPINMVVDVTNYLMAVTAHPLHAFDYDNFIKAQGGGDTADIRIRGGHEGEQLKLLDGRTIELTEEDIVICAGNTPVALAGAMGGHDTEVSDATKTILLESATFNLYNLRSTTMRHGVFSEASTRYTKGQPAAQTAPVLASAIRMLCDVAGGSRASNIVDSYAKITEPSTITVSLKEIEALLGKEISMKQVTDTLLSIECTVDVTSAYQVHVTPPYWRTDLHIPEDVIEEIGRLQGYDNILPTLPKRPYLPVMPKPYDIFRNNLRQTLSTSGANEVLTYSFVNGQTIEKAGQEVKHAYRIVNALSPELQYYRTSLTPSLLEKAHMNIKAHETEFALFELNKVHIKGIEDKTDGNLPQESNRLAFVVAVNDKESGRYFGAPYYQAKSYLDYLLSKAGTQYRIVPLTKADKAHGKDLAALSAPYEPKRSGWVMNQDDQVIGIVGEPKKSVAKGMKLPLWCAGFEIITDTMFENLGKSSHYQPLSRYPGTERDMTFRVRDDVSYMELADVLQRSMDESELSVTLRPIDIYQKEPGSKQITVRLSIVDTAHTITAEEANAFIAELAAAAHKELKAEII